MHCFLFLSLTNNFLPFMGNMVKGLYMTHRLPILLAAALTLSCNNKSTGPTDTSRPAAVTDLAINSASGGVVQFSWTAPGDDGHNGTATYYDLRSAADSSTIRNWGGALQLQGEPTPSVNGTRETATIPNTFVRPRFFAIKVSDEAANTSAISNIVCLCP
jgi:hypothetical protein